MIQEATLDKPIAAAPNGQALARLLPLIYGRFAGQAVCLAAKLGIADQIAAGVKTTGHLAQELSANESSLRRFLKALASHGLIEETAIDHWAVTPAGNLLRGDVTGSLRDLARLFAAQEHAASWLALEYSVLSGKSAFEHVHGEDGWTYGMHNPVFAETFNAAMSSIAGSVHQAVADAFDFSGVELLVDVGGGHGRLMAHILDRFDRLHGIVFDMPHVAAGAAENIARRKLADRCQAVGGDFFESVPAGGDAYIMSAVLHDWDDAACIAILRNCRKAMKKTGRILIVDFVLKPFNQPDFGRNIDLEMLLFTNSGRERTEEDFRQLFQSSDLSLRDIIPLPSGNCLVEAFPI